MKVIDLLNKIANGQKVPKKVKFAGIIFEYDEDDQMYSNDEHKNICDYAFLNDTVEIIEEKKIPEKWNDLSFTTMRKKEDSIDDDIHKLKGCIETIMRTQNEIIDYLDYLKSKGE